MVSGEIFVEDIKSVEATKYTWSIGEVTEEFLFTFNDGRALGICGGEGFFNLLKEAIESHDEYIPQNEVGDDQ